VVLVVVEVVVLVVPGGGVVPGDGVVVPGDGGGSRPWRVRAVVGRLYPEAEGVLGQDILPRLLTDFALFGVLSWPNLPEARAKRIRRRPV
jgi:hypothetical protein